MDSITRHQARMFILTKQGLIGPYRFAGKSGAYDYVRQAGCIQFDPVDVCGKNAELTLQSRVKGFRKNMLAELLYKDRLLVDYADKELSIWPVEDWPYFSSYRDRSRKLGKTFKGISKLRKEAISYISENGPVTSSSLPIEGEIFWHSSMHWSGHWDRKSPAARSILEQLYTDGELVIHHKNGSRKFYDLAEKHIPSDILSAKNPLRNEYDFLCWRVLRRIGAVGLLWDKNSTAFLGLYINADTRKKILSDLVLEGKICAVMVEGIKQPFYYRSEDKELMDSILDGSADIKPRMAFIAPLDPLMWDSPDHLSRGSAQQESAPAEYGALKPEQGHCREEGGDRESPAQHGPYPDAAALRLQCPEYHLLSVRERYKACTDRHRQVLKLFKSEHRFPCLR